jgi:hypothetical protein
MFRKLAALVLLAAFMLAGVMVLAHEGEEMAHIRFGHFAADAPNVDVFVNGETVLEDFAPSSLSNFLDFEPGRLNIAVAPTGEGIEKAIIGPQEVDVEAGHNYSVSVIGQAADDSLKPLVIDETAEMANCDMSKSVFRILINNIAGAPTISFYENDMWVEKNIEYGSYSAGCTPAFFWDTGKAVVGENLDEVLFDFDSEADGNGAFWEPYTVYFWGLMGQYPGTPDEDYYFGGGLWYTVAPTPVDFLAAFSGLGLTFDGDPFFQFDTAVQAIKAAGLEETLAGDEPHTLFIPTDAAFEALPDGTLDELMADPEALKNLLLNHVVEGALTYDDLVEAGTVTTLAENDLTVTPSEDEGLTFRLNDDAVLINFDYLLPNGSRIWFVENAVLMPSVE